MKTDDFFSVFGSVFVCAASRSTVLEARRDRRESLLLLSL